MRVDWNTNCKLADGIINPLTDSCGDPCYVTKGHVEIEDFRRALGEWAEEESPEDFIIRHGWARVFRRGNDQCPSEFDVFYQYHKEDGPNPVPVTFADL